MSGDECFDAILVEPKRKRGRPPRSMAQMSTAGQPSNPAPSIGGATAAPDAPPRPRGRPRKGEAAQLPQGDADSATTAVAREKLQRSCKAALEDVDEENQQQRTSKATRRGFNASEVPAHTMHASEYHFTIYECVYEAGKARGEHAADYSKSRAQNVSGCPQYGIA